MRKVDLAKPELQARIAELFANDAPLTGGVRRLAELQSECDRLCASVPPPAMGRQPERARQLMLLAREYRRVARGMADA